MKIDLFIFLCIGYINIIQKILIKLYLFIIYYDKNIINSNKFENYYLQLKAI